MPLRSGSNPAALVNPMTTTGDLIVGGSAGAASRLAVGANKTLLSSNGTTESWNASPEISGSFTADGGLNVGSATAAGTGEVKSSSHVKAGVNVYPGNQAIYGHRLPLADIALSGNTSTTVSSFPQGRFLIFNRTTPVIGCFDSNSVSTVTDRNSDTTFQIGGADPGASSSKIWVTLASGVLTVFNRFSTAQNLGIIGDGAS